MFRIGPQTLPGEPHITGREATSQLGYFMNLLRTGRVTLDGQGCHHLASTSSNHGIEPHLNIAFNPDTTSALMINT
jgi:hypothetical protein